jgi:transcriptional regulator with XRE-family HTH domain
MLGERIANLRKQKKLSQYDLAERLGFSRGKLANYEQGSRQPDFDTLKLIADFFDVSIDFLLGRTDEPTQESENTEFQEFINDPELQRWYKDLPKSGEDDLKKLRKMWEIMKDDRK